MIATAALIRAAAMGVKGAAVLSASLLLVGVALAQEPAEPPVQQFGPRVNQGQAARQVPKAEVISTHGDWTVQCQTNAAGASAGGEGAAEGERACGMVQSTRHAERKNVSLTLVVVKAEQEGTEVTMMRVMAPIGVFLPTGIAIEIDEEAVGRLPYTRCLPQTCVAFAEASPPTLEKFKKGATANFIIYEAPGISMSMPLSLNGFTAALTKLDEL